MASIAKLKDRARKYEQKEDWEAAIEAYQQVLEKEEGEDELELELGLYNRIGDLHLRLGHTDDAVSFYETAADKYAEAGFFNNAIALCNKALRHRPDRAGIYLKLSRLCSEQGFVTDARRWILEYAERQMKVGRAEEALTGLEDFADLSDDPEIRESLAQQLVAHERQDEALEQLREAHRLHSQNGDSAAAEGAAAQARAIDPSVDFQAEPAATAAPTETGFDGGLEDAGFGDEAGPAATADADEEAAAGAAAGLEGLETRPEDPATEAPEDEPMGLEGFETTAAEGIAEPEEEAEEAAEDLSGLEVSYSEREPAADAAEADADLLGGLETFDAAAEEAEEPEESEAAEAEEAEEAEELPLLDTDLGGAGGEEEEEEGEPLPLLDTGFEDEAEEAGEPEVAAEAAEPEEVEAEEAEPEAAEPEEAEEPEPQPAGAGAGSGSDAMDLDLEGFDLGLESDEAPAMASEDLDTDAVLERGRELVSRGLTGEALRELRLLSGTGADSETFQTALEVVDEIVRHDPNDLGALQRRVEFSARTGQRDLLVDAYLDLADALARLGAETKAHAMYGRVLDLDPENEAAREALGQDAEEEEAIDLDAVLREMEPEEVEVAGAPPAAGSDPGFAAMLSQFKAKVSEPVDSDDAGDHYDLGLAFKEMGLIDEAIAEFQTALTGGTERLKVYEELGQCFIQKAQYNVAVKVLSRALKVPPSDPSELLGVYYHLGQCYEELGQRAEARDAYEKVLEIDESFADVPDRVARL